MNLLIADDHALMRRGIRQIIQEAQLGILVDEVDSVAATLQAIRNKPYDIILLDISFPDGSGLDLLTRIRVSHPETRVLLLSMHSEEQYAQRVFRLGGSGYLTKNSAPDELVSAIQKVMAGGKYVTETLAEQLVTSLAENNDKKTYETLSERELQVLTRLGAGKSISEIALELSLSPKTVSTYRSRMLEKLNLKTTTDIVHYVIDNHLGN